MKVFLRHRFIYRSTPSSGSAQGRDRRLSPRVVWLLLPTCMGIFLGTLATLATAQTDKTIQQQEDQLIRQFTLPNPPPEAPVYQPPAAPVAPSQPEVAAPAAAPLEAAPAPRVSSESVSSPTPQPTSTANNNVATSQYLLEFNRNPIVGNRLRLQGTYAESRLGFTRPRNWNLKAVRALIRFQHSPALLANRSNLTVRVNGTSVGSVPLNRKQSQIGEFWVTIPPGLIQNYNELTLVAQQSNSTTCSDPTDQTLWTEVLPDSKVLFNFQPKPIPLDFSRYPYPFFDDLSLDANQVTYLLPARMNEFWLTAAARYQAGLGRLAEFRPLNTELVKDLKQVRSGQHLVIMGTPEEQPALKSLKLPYAIANNQWLDGSKSPLPADVGLLMLTTMQSNGVPVLVATGNSPEGVTKAMQFLLQPKQRQLGTGSAVLVDQLADVPSPPPRQWSKYLPTQNSFKLADLRGGNNKPFEDVTVRGAYTPPVEFDFRALPDDRFNRGSSMTLNYSYSPQVNPRLSTVEVRLDGTPIGGKRLTSEDGATRESLNVNLPEKLVKPNSKIQVAFNLVPKEAGECGRVADQQLWGKVHSDSSFNLNRENSVQLPSLALLQTGYPFAAPQDLSRTAIALPDAPSNAEVMTLLEFSERLGRLSESDAIKLQVFTAGSLPNEVRESANLVGIGNRDRFPFPEAFQSNGFQLKDLFTRQGQQSQIQTLPDTGGVIKQVISPWNGDRVLLALTAQTDNGMNKVRDLFSRDSLFFQLKDDTVLINTTEQNPSEYDPDAYNLEFLEKADQKRRIENTTLLSKSSHFLKENWFLLPTGMVISSLLLYGIVQLYLKRVANPGGAK